MIDASRFLVRSSERERWLAQRRLGVTATEVAEAATESGFRSALEARMNPSATDYMARFEAEAEFGSESEPEIMRFAHERFGILPSNWLICAEGNARHRGTPDGLSLDHTLIAECKTTGKDWIGKNGYTVPIKYRRQCQWNIHVTGADKCLILWDLRVPDDKGWFYLGWLEPKSLWIERDDAMIRDLVDTADRLLSFEMEAA
jgi:hypothetical protein